MCVFDPSGSKSSSTVGKVIDGSNQKQNHGQTPKNHKKSDENETRRKLKIKDSVL
ncbi:hypothetical protein [Leptospira noguchii]|uniref:Uncharacterized protein n=2 Tax=Leptospira noguchii TaxID=28182 RepID=T0H2L6_9LEPT|nr:hypothetical protein [Leptospira noguchii]EMO54289.1 hypothetical protein LEP1GSC172_3772 [Leptospira noguchii]EQA73621.1 hypothetical protein LEP1GSC059_2533 [Leptospira noguchii serovar Panama str. CZ214]